MPRLQALYDDYRDRGFLPITINLWQDMNSVVKYYARQYEYLFLRDGSGAVWNAYRIGNSIPLNYVIDTAGVVLYGAVGFNETTIRYWIESALPPTGVEERPVLALNIEGVRPSPARGPATVRFAMPQSGTATVRVWSSAGRLVRDLHAGELAAGPGEFTWNLADTRGARVPSGTYFVEVSAAGQTARTKLAVLD